MWESILPVGTANKKRIHSRMRCKEAPLDKDEEQEEMETLFGASSLDSLKLGFLN